MTIVAPPQIPRRNYGGLIQLGATVLGSLGMVAFAFVSPSKTFLIISGVLVVISLVSALANQFAQKRSGKLSAKTQRRLYRQHLAERTAELKALHVQQRTLDERLYPDAAGLAAIAENHMFLWERRPKDRDFLQVRLGRASVRLACGVTLGLSGDPMIEYEPDLLEDARALTETFRQVGDLSVVEALDNAGVVTVAGPREQALSLARSCVAQLATFRAPSELRLMAAFSPQAEEDWSWCKWLPHARAAGRGSGTPALLLAAGAEGLRALLEAQVQPRVEQLRRIETSSLGDSTAEIDAPDLFIFVDGYHAGGDFARIGPMREIALHGPRLKVRMIAIVGPGDAEPPESALRLLLSADGGELTVERTGAQGYRIGPVLPDQLTLANADRIARSLAPLSLQETAGNIDLAADVRLTTLLDLPRGELCGPLGLAEDGTPVVLDLKQAALGGMGPHGLLVGATGSGKSELLRTFVASLSDRHTPEELAFVMIDFKGGAAFAELSKLPHVAGLITNLQQDLTLIDRVQAALFGEIDRRQILLREAGNLDDVTTYRARRQPDSELPPLPHLVMIVDEFGELLANRPEFLDLFLTIGRVGRSLGIHLLLSSQRLEEGRLKGLESHLRYRLCLRTYSAAESKAVLGGPDAFLLPPHPGVGYLSVDTDVFTRFKTAIVTAPAVPEGSDALGRGFVGAFALAAGDGEETPVAEHSAETDLDALIRDLTRRYGDMEPVHQVWLAPLPARLALSSVLAGGRARPGSPLTADPDRLETCLGLADLPDRQRQDPLDLDLSGGGGHLALVGASQSGKSTALRTLLMSLLATRTPDQLRAYVLDFGGGSLHGLAPAPHVGEVAGRGDAERTVGVVRHVRALVAERERRYRELGLESITEARARGRSGELSPELAADVLLVIDNWAGFTRDHESLAPEILEIAAAGLHHGVHLVLSTGRWAEIRANLRDAFGTRLELRLNDPLESDFGRRVAERVPSGVPGRGITPGGTLFQVALPRLDGVASTDGLGAAVSDFAEELDRRWSGARPNGIGILPETVSVAELSGAVRHASKTALGLGAPRLSGAPVGLAELTLEPVALDLAEADRHVLILGEPGSGRTEALRTIAHALAERYGAAGSQMMVIDLRRNLDDLATVGSDCAYVSRPPQIAAAMDELRAECIERINTDARGSQPIIVLVDDYDLVSGVGTNPLAPLGEIIFQGRDTGIHVVLARTTTSSARLQTDPVIARMLEAGASALLLSGDRNEGPLVRGVRAQTLPPGRAILLRRRGEPTLVQLALTGREAASVDTAPASTPAGETAL